MTVHICPRCNQRFIVNENVEDFVHECNSGNATLDNEDILVIGDWEDYTGSGFGQNINMQGIGNKLFGTRAWIEGYRKENVTSRGNPSDVSRTRQHLEFIKLQGGENK